MFAEARIDHLSPAQRTTESLAVTAAPDRHALDAFLASVERRALRIAQIATRDRDEALDIVQDAMLQLARRYAVRPAEEWPPLFHRILDNKILDWQRRRSVRRRLFLSPSTMTASGEDGEVSDPLERIPDPAPDALQRLREQQAMAVLADALDALPARQREAFTLRVWQGLSVDDTAAVMRCSDGSVKTHLSRALAALRGRLQGVWP